MKRLLITTLTLLFAVGAVAAPAVWAQAQTPTTPPSKTDMPGEKKPEKKAHKKRGEKMAKKSEKKSAAKEAEKKAEEKK